MSDSTQTFRLMAPNFYQVIVDSGFTLINYLAIRQRVRVVYERIVNEGEAWVDYSLIDNVGELSNCFSIHLLPRYINFEKISIHRKYTVIFQII